MYKTLYYYCVIFMLWIVLMVMTSPVFIIIVFCVPFSNVFTVIEASIIFGSGTLFMSIYSVFFVIKNKIEKACGEFDG